MFPLLLHRHLFNLSLVRISSISAGQWAADRIILDMGDRIHAWLFSLGDVCMGDRPVDTKDKKHPWEKKEQDEPEEELEEVLEEEEEEELEHGHDWMVALLDMSQFLKLGSCHLFVFEVTTWDRFLNHCNV